PVSILFQSETLFEHLSAARNIGLGLAPEVRRAEAALLVEQALSEVGLQGLGGQTAETMSGGQKQRVALARTLLRDRPILLLDEPFSALDDETRESIRTLVRSLTEERRWTTILVSHHAADVATLASRSYLLENGGLRPLEG